MFVVQLSLNRPAGHEVGIDGLDPILVKGGIGFAQSEGVGGEEGLAGLAFWGV